MKKFLSSLAFTGLMSLNMSPSALGATVTCQKAVSGPVTSQGQIFQFTATVHCDLRDVATDLGDIKTAYLQHMQNSPNTYRVVSSRSDSQDGYTGSTLQIVESLALSHGDMDIESDVFLGDDQSSRFVYSSQSRRILKATRDTRHTQARNLKVEAKEVAQGSYQLTATIAVTVKRPAFAPTSLFKAQAIKGIENELPTIAKAHGSLIASPR